MPNLKRSNALLMLLISSLLLAGLWAGVSAISFALDDKEQPQAEESLPQAGLPEMDALIAGKRYHLEVAITPKQAEIGLMHRTLLPAGQGMLFQFDSARPVAFWMKNTKIPLDMLFVRDGQVVNIAHQARPCVEEPCATYPSGSPVDMVIELPAGTARQDQIQPGSSIRLIPVAQAAPLPMKSRTLMKK